MVWQSSDKVKEQRALFDKVAGLPVFGEWIWRNSITWTAAALLALSLEQSMKAIAIYRGWELPKIKTHNLKLLWDKLEEEDRKGIERELERVRGRAKATRLGEWKLKGGADAIVRAHEATFEMARYYLEDRPGQAPMKLKHNIELWQLAFAVFLYGQCNLPVPAGFAEKNRAHIL